MLAERMLIVNADDFGLTPGVCEGILRAHDGGIVRSTSALTIGPAYEEWGPRLRRDGLGVGIHFALVGEDPPALAPGRIPSLVDDEGRFPLDWRSFVARAAVRGVRRREVEAELTAQVERLLDHRIRPDHIDTHQNLHLWPGVASTVVALAERYQIPAIRMTSTRRWSPTSVGVRLLSAHLRRICRRAGLHFPDMTVGLDHAGHLGLGCMERTIDDLAARPWASAELATHPGADPDPDRARYEWGYEWSAELEALRSPAISDRIERHGLTLGRFSDLDRPGSTGRGDRCGP